VVHELAVLLRFLFREQVHRAAAPDFPDAAAGVAVEHEGGGVKAGHRGDVASAGVDRFFAIGC